MARRRTAKANNGEGESGLISLAFNLDDPVEVEAYEMARQLARPHGRRKHVIVALLYGLAMYQRRTGVELNTDVVMAMALSGNLLGGGLLTPQEPARPRTLEDPTVVVSSANKASAKEVAQNFLSSMGGLFD